MSTYFPFLRGKQNELLALRRLAIRIAESGKVCPILELVNGNSTTRISLDQYVAAGMPFLLVTNPRHGQFAGSGRNVCDEFVHDGPLAEYDNYIPALYVGRDTQLIEVQNFTTYTDTTFRAVIYLSEPVSGEVRNWCTSDTQIYHHIIKDGTVSAQFLGDIADARKVILRDHFNRQEKNADYPSTELYTDWNTMERNPSNLNWGDYSIQGDHYSDTGGPAYAVAIHHIHYSGNGSSLDISHFVSDRTETPADVPGKILEAVEKLVANLDSLRPNDTLACEEYRKMNSSGNSRGLGYLKRLAILHHLELMLQDE